jgi:threonylcarbamoyladenosine tRNA methylthiotransferase MtaB
MSKSFKIITLGCKVNQFESAYVSEALVHAGWRPAAKGERADAAIVNTCIVTQKAAYQSRQAIRKIVRENPQGRIAAIGCYVQVFPHELTGIHGVDLLVDNTAKGQLPELLSNTAGPGGRRVVLKGFEPGMAFEPLKLVRFTGRTRAFLKIQDGCQSFCSYCIVPFARGPYRSLSPAKVLSMVECLAKQGYKEIVLSGIHLGKYGVDLEGEMNINRLLRAIGREKFPVRVRLSSLDPNEIGADLIELVASEEWICRHFHIPLQSGDDRILKKMNRNYTAQEFARMIKSIRANIPLAAIGVDILSGFPGEDAVAHQNTYSLISDLPVSYLHVFPFSPRPGTAAADFEGQVDPKVIKRRAAELRKLGHGKRVLFYRSCLKKAFDVLIEGWHSEEKGVMRGISDNYLLVLLPSSHQQSRGQLVPVQIEGVKQNSVIGSLRVQAFPNGCLRCSLGAENVEA